jgi:hypothetical protein
LEDADLQGKVIALDIGNTTIYSPFRSVNTLIHLGWAASTDPSSREAAPQSRESKTRDRASGKRPAKEIQCQQ